MRSTLASLAAATVIGLTFGCTPTTSPTSTAPSATPTTAIATPTPGRTYGPNQTAAMAAVTAYYGWINTASKDPKSRDFTLLNQLAEGEAFTSTVAEINTLLQMQRHRVGDLVVAQMVPDAEQATQIGMSVCLDASTSVLVDANGQVVQPADGLSRRAYALKVKVTSGKWLVVEDRGGGTPC